MTSNPAHNLVGQIISGLWRVTDKLKSDATDSTGGYFSVPYKVEHIETGEMAFLKVIDMMKALQLYQDQGVSTAEGMQIVGSSHLFECELADSCTGRRMTRVVRAIEHGEIKLMIPGTTFELGHGFLLFELGQGDTHSLLHGVKATDDAWKFKTLHQTAVGLRQLHEADIAHQDLKRSNVVFFGDDNAKLCDLGRAVKRGRPSRNDLRLVPCQPQNSPFELLYGLLPNEWDGRHFSTDLFMLGNLAFSIFNDATLTFSVLQSLPPELLPSHLVGAKGYQGPYLDVIPALRNALARTLVAGANAVPACVRETWSDTLMMLCEPDPAKRGHPKDIALEHGRKHSAERFVSSFRNMELKVRYSKLI